MATNTLVFHTWARSSILDNAEVHGPRLVKKITLKLDDNSGNLTKEQLKITFLGPQDVIGLKPSAIKHMAPAPFTNDAESEKLVHIDFYDKDLPWRYTPQPAITKQNTSKLKPWLVLIVDTADNFAIAGDQVTINPAVLNKHDLEHSPTWAHTQGEGNLEFSRIVSPARLTPQSEHLAILVPAFKDTGEQRWSNSETNPVSLPIYHSWRFWTAEAGDFEALASALHVEKAGDIGRAKLTYRHQQRDNNQAVNSQLLVGGAITSLKPDLGLLKADELTDSELRDVLIQLDSQLRDSIIAGYSREQLINKIHDMQKPFKDAIEAARHDLDGINNEQTVTGEKFIGLPAYGRPWIPDPDAIQNGWPQEINDDPRFRGVAGLGARMGVQNQESLIQAAVTQAGALTDARHVIANLALGLHLSKRLWDRHLPNNYLERLRILGPMMSRMVTDDGGIVLDRITSRSSPLPAALFSGAAQRILRDQASHTRHLRIQSSRMSEAFQSANRASDQLQIVSGLPSLSNLVDTRVFPKLKDIRGQVCTFNQSIAPVVKELKSLLDTFGVIYRLSYDQFHSLHDDHSPFDMKDQRPILIDMSGQTPSTSCNLKATVSGTVQPTIIGGDGQISILQTEIYWTQEVHRRATPDEIQQMPPTRQREFANGNTLIVESVPMKEISQGDRSFNSAPNRDVSVIIQAKPKSSSENTFICAILQLRDLKTGQSQEVPILCVSNVIQISINDPTLRKSALLQLNAYAFEWLRRQIEALISKYSGIAYACMTSWLKSLESTLRPLIDSPTATPPVLLSEAAAQAKFVYSFEQWIRNCFTRRVVNQDVLVKDFPDFCPAGPESAIKPINLEQLGTVISKALDPRQESPPAKRRVCDRLVGVDCAGLIPPEFPIGLDFPTWTLLRAHDEEWLLPGVGNLKKNTITALRTNPAFIDAFMVGINSQFLAEMRWRNLAVNRKCTPLRMFWGQINSSNNKRQADIQPIDQWKKSLERSLGDKSHQTLHEATIGGDSSERLVLVFKSDLFRRYPSTLVYLVKPDSAVDVDTPISRQNSLNPLDVLLSSPPDFEFRSQETEGSPQWEKEFHDWRAKRKFFGPVFIASIKPDVTFFIFDIKPETLDQYWLILDEPPTELRFRHKPSPHANDAEILLSEQIDQPTRVAWEGKVLEEKAKL